MSKQMAKLLIHNGRVWNGYEFIPGDVAIEEGKIAAVGDTSGFVPEYSYDAKGSLILPGLVDGHVHLKHVSIDQWGCLPESTMYPLGVTAVVEAGCSTTDKTVDTFELKTLLYISTDIIDDEVEFTKVEEILAAHPEKAIGIKAYFDVGVSDVRTIAPMEKICRFAREHGLRVMVHSTNPPVPMGQLLDCLAPGDICTHVFHGVGHTAYEDEFACLRRAKERGVILDTGIAGGVHCDFTLMKKAVEAGILPDIISSDIVRLSCFRRGGCFGLPTVMSMFRNFGMDEAEILRAVTSTPAKVHGMQDQWGALEVGRCADLTILGYDKLVIDGTDRTGNRLCLDEGYYCKLTIVNGDIVYRNGLC